MANIKKLSFLEAKKIAAGEVVERPANVIKELIENSIDAGATEITVHIVDGGRTLMRVIDNGCGMSHEDALLSFEHHATSKINTVDDLETLHTFGFRGEALSSISAVGKVTLVTKDAASAVGVKLYLEDAVVQQEEEIACTVGTDITVEHLFFNIPARLKFLKKDETEYRQLVALFQGYCFAYKQIHFKLYNNNALAYNCPPVQDEKSRIAQLWDSSLVRDLFQVAATHKNPAIEIYGSLTNYQHYQYNKSKIFTFVNKRLVKNTELSRAILKGYANVLPQGKFPAGVLFIEVPPAEIDVNIHPRKEEVKLLHSYKVEQIIQQAIQQGLEKLLTSTLTNTVRVSPAQPLSVEKSLSLFSMPKNAIMQKQQQFEQSFKPASLDLFKQSFVDKDIMQDAPSAQQSFSSSEFHDIFGTQLIETQNFPIVGVDTSIEDSLFLDYNYIGQFKKTYLMLECQDALVLVDQHAAHESVLYDIFLNKFESIAMIKLLFPHVIHLTPADMSLIIPYLDVLKRYGIELEIFGEQELVIQATPVHLKNDALDELVLQIISWIQESKQLEKDDFDVLIAKKLCAQMACKAAVKAGDELSREQVMQLLQDLSATSNRFKCPHGRPTLWNLSLYEIEKKFKRKI